MSCCISLLFEIFSFLSSKDELRVGAGGALGSLCTAMSEYEIKDLLIDELLGKCLF